ncbi:MAG: hypothetical protein KDA91_21290 [Planctomycetaceae bacterium]|nr:hypothetical protein [Planctomycetaceae bacterium]
MTSNFSPNGTSSINTATAMNFANRISGAATSTPAKENKNLEQGIQSPHRTLGRSLVISCGTTASKCASQIKGRLTQQGANHITHFLALDTDEAAQSGAGGWPSFSDDEFVLMATDRVRNVIDNPAAHPDLVDRYELDNPNNMAFLKRIVSEGPTQAGQVRLLGNLCWQASFPQVRNAVRRTLRSLMDAQADLRKQLECDAEISISRRITIYVLFSNAGGTGSSMALELMSLLRLLTRNLDVEIVACMFMPSTFEAVLTGHPAQQLRIAASAHATAMEMDSFRQGLCNRLQLGPGGRNSFPAESNFCDQLYVVGPNLANGRALESPQGVQDAVALAFAGQIGTEVRDQLKVDEANQATLRGMAPDPVTGRDRYVGTMGATALALPVDRISKFCTALKIMSLLDDCWLRDVPLRDSATQARGWLDRPGTTSGLSLQPPVMTRRLKNLVLPKPGSVIRSLFRHVGPTKSVHLSTGRFIEQAEKLMSHFKNVQLGEMETRLNNFADDFIQEFRKSFTKAAQRIVQSSGYLGVRQFASAVAEQTEMSIKQLAAESLADQQRSENMLAKAKETLAVLSTSMRMYPRDPGRRNQAASLIQSSVVSAVDGLTKSAVKVVLEGVYRAAIQWRDRASAVIENANSRRVEIIDLLRNSTKIEHQITTNSLVEIDVSTEEIDRTLYRRFQPDTALVLEKLGHMLDVPASRLLERITADQTAFELLIQTVNEEFTAALKRISIVDFVAELLKDPASQREMQARIRQMVVGCQPMWDAESGQLSTEFSETLIIGIPRCPAEGKHAAVKAAVLAAATRSVNPNGQYNSEPCAVTISDPHTIYVIRMTQGGCFHYLPEVAACKDAYDEWNRIGGHTVHTFNAGIVSRFPDLLPISKADRGDAAFAVAMAYSIVVQRGPNWYWNLKTTGSGFECSLTSHRDSLIFKGGQIVEKPGAVEQLIHRGRLLYKCENDIALAELMGESLVQAQRTFTENLEMIEAVEKWLKELRVTVGNDTVASELSQFGEQLKSVHRSDRDRELLMKIAATLMGLAVELRQG